MAWAEAVDRLADDLERVLAPPARVRALLPALVAHDLSPVRGVELTVERRAPFCPLRFAAGSTTGPHDARSIVDLEDASGYVTMWLRAGQRTLPPTTTEALAGLLRGAYHPRLRARAGQARLPLLNLDVDRDHDADLLGRSVAALCERAPALCVWFADLDNFGSVNKRLTYEVANAILEDFANALDAHFGDEGLVMQLSGDEFLVFHPVDSADEGVDRALSLARFMETSGLPLAREKAEQSAVAWPDDLVVSASLGMALADAGAHPAPIELKRAAERALNQMKKVAPGERRGHVRLHLDGEAPSAALPALDECSEQLTALTVKGQLLEAAPFPSPWLNVLSREVHAAARRAPAAIEHEVGRLLRWLAPAFTPGARLAWPGRHAVDADCTVSGLDLGAAIAHGLLRAHLYAPFLPEAELWLEYDPAGLGCRVIAEGDALALSFGDVGAGGRQVRLGAADDLVDPAGAPPRRRVGLVEIGWHDEVAARQIVGDQHVRVDDSPWKYGRLPDFWEPALAQVLTWTRENPNLELVLVLGSPADAARTTHWLRRVDAWPEQPSEAMVQYLAFRTGLRETVVMDAARKLRGRVRFVTRGDELRDAVSTLLWSRARLAPPSADDPLRRAGPRAGLRRHLVLDGQALLQTDGCRADTAAEAFPLTVGILHEAGDDALVTGHTGRRYTLVTDFKIVVRRPAEEPIPRFYADDVATFDEYYARALGPGGLLAEPLERGGQIERLLDHLAMSIVESRPTHRASAVVANDWSDDPGDPSDIRPLGLIGLRVVPRYRGPRVLVDVGYSWPTVDVLVGLPYSLYGAVRHSQALLQRLRDRLPPDRRGRLSLGSLAYIAHSLHMRLDDYSEAIARRIVDDSTVW